jgi:uncharacterized membrane protein YfcA
LLALKRGTRANLASSHEKYEGFSRGLTLHAAYGSEIGCKSAPTLDWKVNYVNVAVTLNAFHIILLILGGLGAGIFNGVAGGGSLISFPLLLGLGFPALTANLTNTVGIWPGYLGSAAGFRTQIADQREQMVRLSPVAVSGAIVGAILLLTTSSATFRTLAPWLVLAASLLFSVQPLLRRALQKSESDATPTRPVLLVGGTFLASVYGGYFGAGLGVMLLAILGLALPDTIARSSGLRTVLSIMVNGVAALVFMIHGGLAWAAAGYLALGALVGGWVGARLALAISPTALRIVVVAIGLGTTIKLLA